jgi:hypothetical protein
MKTFRVFPEGGDKTTFAVGALIVPDGSVRAHEDIQSDNKNTAGQNHQYNFCGKRYRFGKNGNSDYQCDKCDDRRRAEDPAESHISRVGFSFFDHFHNLPLLSAITAFQGT